jgi:hypothetical protein
MLATDDFAGVFLRLTRELAGWSYRRKVGWALGDDVTNRVNFLA